MRIQFYGGEYRALCMNVPGLVDVCRSSHRANQNMRAQEALSPNLIVSTETTRRLGVLEVSAGVLSLDCVTHDFRLEMPRMQNDFVLGLELHVPNIDDAWIV